MESIVKENFTEKERYEFCRIVGLQASILPAYAECRKFLQQYADGHSSVKFAVMNMIYYFGTFGYLNALRTKVNGGIANNNEGEKRNVSNYCIV